MTVIFSWQVSSAKSTEENCLQGSHTSALCLGTLRAKSKMQAQPTSPDFPGEKPGTPAIVTKCLAHPSGSPSCPTSLHQITIFFFSGGQSFGVPDSSSILPMNIQDLFSLGWTGWSSLMSKRLSRVFSNTTVQKHQSFGTQLSSQSNSHAWH